MAELGWVFGVGGSRECWTIWIVLLGRGSGFSLVLLVWTSKAATVTLVYWRRTALMDRPKVYKRSVDRSMGSLGVSILDVPFLDD